LLKMYFFVSSVRPSMHHNYGVIAGSHACRDCVWPTILDAELYTTWPCPGERVSVAIRFNVIFLLQGQVKKALRSVDHASDIDGKHEITTDIKKNLKEMHPKAAELKQSAIIDKPKTKTERVIFENVTQDEIASNTKNSSGSEDQHRLTWTLGEK